MTVEEQAKRARRAALQLSRATRSVKDAGLHAMADALGKAETAVLDANAADIARAEAGGPSIALIDRLRLNPDRIAGMADGLRALAALPDPVGDVVRGWTNANGVQVRQVRVPFGVVGIIYEARPNVTADAAGICLKSGNAVLLRGSSSAADSNAAIVEALQAGLADAGLPSEAIQLVPGPRSVTSEMMAARGLIDLLIPRGGAGLIETVVRDSQVPVIETGVGNCHLYVDASADEEMALDILLNAKTQRPSVCNAVETLLVHADVAGSFLPKALRALVAAGVVVHGDARVNAVRTGGAGRGVRLRHGVPLHGPRRLDRRLPGRRAASHPALQHRAQRDDRHRLSERSPAVLCGGGRGSCAGERVQPLRGRWRIRLRCGDRHLDPEAPCSRADGPAGDDHHEVRRYRFGSGEGVTPLEGSPHGGSREHEIR